MAKLNVRQLDDAVAQALRARAAKRGLSLHEEVRATLAASVEARRRAYRRRAAAVRVSIGTAPTDRTAESTRLIRHEREARD